MLAAAALGVLFACGSLLAIYLELEGFGRPRDGEPRVGYLLLLALGFVASVAAPVAVARLLQR